MNLENYTNVNIFKKYYEQRQVADSNNMIEHSHNHSAAGPTKHHGFNPYQNNEGTVIGKSNSRTHRYE